MQPASSSRTVALSTALLALALAAAPALAQSSRYVSLGFVAPPVQAPTGRFPEPNGEIRLLVAAGYLFARDHGLELRVTHVRAETMQYVVPTICCGEAPVTIGVRATPIELGYFYRPGLLNGLLRPRVGVGAIAARVEDSWRSDTPAERTRSWQYGTSASVGLGVRLVGETYVFGRGGYQRISESERRPTNHLGLTGHRVDAGLEIGF